MNYQIKWKHRKQLFWDAQNQTRWCEYTWKNRVLVLFCIIEILVKASSGRTATATSTPMKESQDFQKWDMNGEAPQHSLLLIVTIKSLEMAIKGAENLYVIWKSYQDRWQTALNEDLRCWALVVWVFFGGVFLVWFGFFNGEKLFAHAARKYLSLLAERRLPYCWRHIQLWQKMHARI